MVTIAYFFCGALAVMALVQAVFGAGFVWALLRPTRRSAARQSRAAVVLCLRGDDPFLPHCIEGLLAQDYTNYQVVIVVDHQDDPANRVVGALLAEQRTQQVRVEILRRARTTCSLKCSSMVQAVESLDDSVEFVAFLDADAIPHRTWLSELSAALADPRVGAATGNRWYHPDRPNLAALVRRAWNTAAVVMMYWRGIPWGGTLAVKTDVLRNTDLLEKWSNAFCEDTMLYSHLKSIGKRVAFVPSLMMINRESCSLSGMFRWLRRQLLAARLYHPAWLTVVLHGVGGSLVVIAAIALGLFALLSGSMEAAQWALGGALCYQVAMATMQLPLEWAVSRVVRARGEQLRRSGTRQWLLNFLAVLATHFVYLAALASSSVLQSVDWRGIRYRIAGPWNVQLIEYAPYQRVVDAQDAGSL